MNNEASNESARFKERSIRKLLRNPERGKIASATDSRCSVFYVGDSSFGPVGIAASMRVDGNTHVPVNDALHGLVLGVVELKIQFLENWLQSQMDIAPGLQQSEVNSEFLSIMEEENSSELTLHLPVQYWHLVPQFPSQYFPKSWRLNWATYKGNVTLSKLTFKPEEAEKIKEGSLVLIPESFQEQWESSLGIPELSISMPGHYKATESSWTVSGGFEVVSSESVIAMSSGVSQDDATLQGAESNTEIRGVMTYSLDVSAKTMVPSIGVQTLTSTKSSTHRECRLALSNGKIYSGYIAPVASGFGFYVTATSVL